MGEVQTLALALIEVNPGIARAELAELIWPMQNPYYSVNKASDAVTKLIRRGLVELGVIHEGGRYNVPGLYLVGQPRVQKPGILGVSGRSYPKGSCAYCGLNTPFNIPCPYCLDCIKLLVSKGLGGNSLRRIANEE